MEHTDNPLQQEIRQHRRQAEKEKQKLDQCIKQLEGEIRSLEQELSGVSRAGVES